MRAVSLPSFQGYARRAEASGELSWGWFAGAAALLGALIALLFGSALGSSMMPDDPAHIFVGRIANEHGLASAHEFYSAQLLRPFPVLAYGFQYWLFGIDVRGHRAVNGLWHLANALLVLLLAWRFTASRALAFLAAALFATHFAHWENAVWMAAVEDVYAGFFVLCALLAYERFCRSKKAVWYVAASVAAIVAFLSKEVGLAAAPMLLALDFAAYGGEGSWRQRLAASLGRTLPLLLLSGLFAAQVAFTGRLGRFAESGRWDFYGMHIPRHWVNYPAWMLWPYGSAGQVPGLSEQEWGRRLFPWIFGAARVAGVGSVLWLLLRGNARLRLLTLWLLLAILPYTFRTVMFPRYAYIATALFAVLAAAAAQEIVRRRPGLVAGGRRLCVALVAVNVVMMYVSPSVAEYKGFAREAEPLITEVWLREEEIVGASAVWLIDPPAFSPPGMRERQRMWHQILMLVTGSDPPSRCLSWSEWQTLDDADRPPPGARVYRWHELRLERVR